MKVNTINLIGRLTKKPELRKTSTGKSVCEFCIAVNRFGNDGTDFITCQAWNVQAENLCKYQDKGSLIGITGNLRVDTYQDKDGNNRYKTYVLVNNIEYLSKKEEPSEFGEDVETITFDPNNVDYNDFLPF